MSNPDNNNIGIKLQIAGENLNTWGAPNLNNDLSVLSNIASLFHSITINGNYTVSETLYATNNDTEVALIKLVQGTAIANFNFVMPSRNKRLIMWNATNYAAQVMLAASAGFSLPAGYTAIIATDGATDVYNVTPNLVAGALTVAGQIHGVSNPTANTDGANKTYVDTAIATAGLPATAGTVLNSGGDTTAGYLSQKATASGLLAATTTSPGGAEGLNFAVIGYAATGTNTYSISPSPTPTARVAFQTSYIIRFTNGNTGPCTLNDGLGAVAITKNGAAALTNGDIPAGSVRMLTFDGTNFQIASVPTFAQPMVALAKISNYGAWGAG